MESEVDVEERERERGGILKSDFVLQITRAHNDDHQRGTLSSLVVVRTSDPPPPPQDFSPRRATMNFGIAEHSGSYPLF